MKNRNRVNALLAIGLISFSISQTASGMELTTEEVTQELIEELANGRGDNSAEITRLLSAGATVHSAPTYEAGEVPPGVQPGDTAFHLAAKQGFLLGSRLCESFLRHQQAMNDRVLPERPVEAEMLLLCLYRIKNRVTVEGSLEQRLALCAAPLYQEFKKLLIPYLGLANYIPLKKLLNKKNGAGYRAYDLLPIRRLYPYNNENSKRALINLGYKQFTAHSSPVRALARLLLLFFLTSPLDSYLGKQTNLGGTIVLNAALLEGSHIFGYEIKNLRKDVLLFYVLINLVTLQKLLYS